MLKYTNERELVRKAVPDIVSVNITECPPVTSIGAAIIEHVYREHVYRVSITQRY